MKTWQCICVFEEAQYCFYVSTIQKLWKGNHQILDIYLSLKSVSTNGCVRVVRVNHTSVHLCFHQDDYTSYFCPCGGLVVPKWKTDFFLNVGCLRHRLHNLYSTKPIRSMENMETQHACVWLTAAVLVAVITAVVVAVALPLRRDARALSKRADGTREVIPSTWAFCST